jgi:hypothetical protein
MPRVIGCWRRMGVQLLACCLEAMRETGSMGTTVVIDSAESQTKVDYAVQRYGQNDKTNYSSMGNFETRQTGNTVGSSLHACES